MADRKWTKKRLEQDLEELQELLGRAKRESRGRPDDLVAQRLLAELIEKRQLQIRAYRADRMPG